VYYWLTVKNDGKGSDLVCLVQIGRREPGREGMIPIEVHLKSGYIDGDVHRFAERRLGFALDRLRNLRRIVISMEDVNGPKGGVDKHCRIVAEFGFASVVVDESQPGWQSAVARAIRRAARKATRELQRVNRLSSRRAHRPPLKTSRMRGKTS
jgi:putative sigma-54 modulation protein